MRPPSPALPVEGAEEFEVEESLTHKPKGRRKTDPRVKFLIMWKSCGEENDTREPYKNLKNAHAVLKSIGTQLLCEQPRRLQSLLKGLMMAAWLL